MKTAQKKLGIALLVIAALIVVTSLILWIIGILDRPTSMLSGAGALFLLGIVAVTRPREESDE